MKNNKFKIYTLGCKVNQCDSRELKTKLKQIGLNFVREKADWAIINTCAVTKTAIRKDRQMISKARNENPEAKIILLGCFPKVYKEEANELGVDYVFGVREGGKIVDLISSHYLEDGIATLHSVPLAMTREKVRYFLKIQDGCEQFCTYCIIPFTRGKLQSREESEIIKEVEGVVSRGVKEIVLTGIHLGLYGQKSAKTLKHKNNSVILNEAKRNEESQKEPLNAANRDPSSLAFLRMTNLVDLINKILKNKGLERLRLSSIEINEVSDELVELIKNDSRICKHLHIPLQSGSEKILKLMNRPYDKKYFQNRLDQIKKQIPDIAISTDVIVGFPGEGRNEFKETYDFIKKNKFSKLHVFPFSAHEKTPAFKLPDKVDQKIIIERAAKLRKLGEKLEREYINKFKNKELKVMIENIKDGKCVGKSEFYFDMEFENDDYKIGEMAKVKNNRIPS